MLNVIVAGYGIVGKKRCKTVVENENTNLVAVCDKNFQHDGVFPDGVKLVTIHNPVR